jgi:hypothetical protein
MTKYCIEIIGAQTAQDGVAAQPDGIDQGFGSSALYVKPEV